MQNQELNNNRESVNQKIAKLKHLGATKGKIWRERLRNRSI